MQLSEVRHEMSFISLYLIIFLFVRSFCIQSVTSEENTAKVIMLL